MGLFNSILSKLSFFDDLSEKLNLDELDEYLTKAIERGEALQARIDEAQNRANRELDAVQAEAQAHLDELKEWREKVEELEQALEALG